jgi:hypothetical protein
MDTTRTPPNGGVLYSVIDQRYLGVLGTHVRRGRAFTADDVRSGARVAVINQTTADFYWPNQNPIGKCLMLRREAACTEIVGVVDPVMLFHVVNGPAYAQLYLTPSHPAARHPRQTLFVRAAGDPQRVAADVRHVLIELAPGVPYIGVRLVGELVAPQLRPWRLGATMFTLFGAVALAIAAVGLYSVMAFWVAQRRFELGVRMALGAQAANVRALVLREAARTLGVGLAIGFVIAAVAAPRAASLMFETSPHDPVVYGVVLALLAIAGLAASIVPAWRSTKVDPLVAIRAE